MDAISRIEALATKARQAPLPASDVADAVLSRIRTTPPQIVRPIGIFAGAVAMVAASLLVLAVCTTPHAEPEMALFLPPSLEMQ